MYGVSLLACHEGCTSPQHPADRGKAGESRDPVNGLKVACIDPGKRSRVVHTCQHRVSRWCGYAMRTHGYLHELLRFYGGVTVAVSIVFGVADNITGLVTLGFLG